MITSDVAFDIASRHSLGIKLSRNPYDFGDSWCFDYGGDEDITGPLPVIVRKKDGVIIPFIFPDDEIRLANAPRVVGN